MASSTSASVAIALFSIAVFVIALRLHGRVHLGEDFTLARRRLPAELTGLSHAFNALPLWMCLAIMTTAFSIGLGAIWLGLAMIVGTAIDWWLIAPYLRTQTAATGSESLSKWFAATAGDKLQRTTLRSASAIVLIAFGLASITILQWSATQIAAYMGISYAIVIALSTFILLATTMLAGLWSASVSDAVLAIVIALLFLVLMIACIASLDTFSSLARNLANVSSQHGRWFGGYVGLLSVSIVTGLMFAAFGSAAQPHVVARYLACRDEVALRKARKIALAWTVAIVTMLLLIGWSARVLLHEVNIPNSRALIAELLENTLPTPIAGIMAGCIAIALAVASLSLWVSMSGHVASAIRHDISGSSLNALRVGVVVVALFVGTGAFYLPLGTADRFWFAWQSVGAAFGPLLLVRLTGKRVRPGSSLGAMWSGFILTILFHLMPDTPGDLLERSLPFIAALGIALSGGERRRNPDRADRGDKTVHDHLPI